MAEIEKNGQNAFKDTVHAAQGLGAIALTYNWLAESVNLLGSVFMAERGALLPGFFDFPFGPGLLFPGYWWPLWHCIFVGFFTYVILRWVCQREWVRVTYVIRDCIQPNPFGIFFCFWKIVSVWVLRIICRWRYHIISIPIWICFVVWVWRWF